MANNICLNCGRIYRGITRFCPQCVIELEKNKNRCSSKSTPLCKNAVFDDDDAFCCYCGSLTTYAKERIDNGEISLRFHCK